MPSSMYTTVSLHCTLQEIHGYFLQILCFCCASFRDNGDLESTRCTCLLWGINANGWNYVQIGEGEEEGGGRCRSLCQRFWYNSWIVGLRPKTDNVFLVIYDILHHLKNRHMFLDLLCRLITALRSPSAISPISQWVRWCIHQYQIRVRHWMNAAWKF